jgi:1-acyl-sn-glycerol-3-phosphate acyltransferase
MSQVSSSDAPSRDDAGVDLSRFEKLAIELGRLTNETSTGKKVQDAFLRRISYVWIRACLSHRMFADGLEKVLAMNPDRGVLFATNHRSFFDQYAVLLALWMGQTPWMKRLYFPVRSNFFYERPLGLLVNYLVGAGAMYPPIFRQAERTRLNKEALERIMSFLQEPGSLVGVHPEGTRGKGPDPYEMLPAQPGIGQIALQSKPIVLPVFINGLSNDIVKDVRANYEPDIRRIRPCICVFGEPVEYDDLKAQKPRPALYKRTADRFRDAIIALMPREREIREMCRLGAIPDDHPGWLDNFGVSKIYIPPPA